MHRVLPAPALLVLATLAGCGPSGGPPAPVAYGRQACDHCHMTIAEPRYAAQLVTRTGKVYAFDEPGCLALFYREAAVPRDDVAGLWVNDFLDPTRRLHADSAVYIRTGRLHTPMGSGLAAVRPGAEADSLQRMTGGDVLSWRAVLELPDLHAAQREEPE